MEGGNTLGDDVANPREAARAEDAEMMNEQDIDHNVQEVAEVNLDGSMNEANLVDDEVESMNTERTTIQDGSELERTNEDDVDTNTNKLEPDSTIHGDILGPIDEHQTDANKLTSLHLSNIPENQEFIANVGSNGDFATESDFAVALNDQVLDVTSAASPDVVRDGDDLYVDLSNFTGRVKIRQNSYLEQLPTPVSNNLNAKPQDSSNRGGTGPRWFSPGRTFHRQLTGSSDTDSDEEIEELATPRQSMLPQFSSRRLLLRENAPSRLHALCESDAVTVEDIRSAIVAFPDAISTPDSVGRLPLHILSYNRDLLSTREGRRTAQACGALLMERYPEGITTKDFNGQMPFVYLILRWVQWTYYQDEMKMQSSREDLHNTYAHRIVNIPFHTVAFVVSALQQVASPQARSSRRSTASSANVALNIQNSMRDSMKRFPASDVTEEVEWAFRMVSLGMDYLGGKSPDNEIEGESPYRLPHAVQRAGRQALAENILSVPLLIKNVIMIENRTTRKRILSCSAIKRVLLYKASAGPWVSYMLRQKGIPSRVAIDYLELISRTSIEDFVGRFRTTRTTDFEQFHDAKLDVFREIERLQSTIPSLIVLPTAETQRAVATPVIWYCMNRSLLKPLVVGTAVIDLGMYFTLMLTFRNSVVFQGDDVPDGAVFDRREQGAVFILCLHYVLRRVCEAMALSKISLNVVREQLLNWWVLADMLAIGSTMWAITVRIDDDTNWSVVFASILGLLWLRILGYLKVVNEQMATFVLALFQILMDIRYFLVCMSVILFSFADVFNVIFSANDEVECAGKNLAPSNADFCSSSLNSYLRTYAILLGDFEMDDYRDATAVTAVWFFLTLFGVIIMLNVLIAVISESYSKSQKSSALLFRSARADFIAGHRAIEAFLRYDTELIIDPDNDGRSNKLKLLWWRVMAGIWRWTILVSLIFTGAWSLVFLAVRTIDFRPDHANIFMTLITVVICVIIGIGLLVILTFSLNVLVKDWFPNSPVRDKLMIAMVFLNGILVRLVATTLFGINKEEVLGSVKSLEVVPEEEDKVTKSIAALHRRVEKLLTENQHALIEQNAMMERRLELLEQKLLGQMDAQSLHKQTPA